MFTTLRNAWKIPELRKKILFTLFVLLIYRLGSCVPVPYVNIDLLAETFRLRFADTVLGLYNAMSGSAFSQATVFAGVGYAVRCAVKRDADISGSA